MSTTTEDVAAAAADTLVCTARGAIVSRPAPCRFAPLWDAGWRWIGTQGLYSCPDCPPVLIVRDGRHVRP
jgi:hypothetical protein